MSDIDTAAADSLKALDLEWPIREVDVGERLTSRIVDDEALPPELRVGSFDGPGQREAAMFHPA